MKSKYMLMLSLFSFGLINCGEYAEYKEAPSYESLPTNFSEAEYNEYIKAYQDFHKQNKRQRIKDARKQKKTLQAAYRVYQPKTRKGR